MNVMWLGENECVWWIKMEVENLKIRSVFKCFRRFL